ncbi:MAG TPA: glycosyltransferase family 39 protein [Xanthobacteraceae bacterium]|jgi:hypothetical protein
MSSGELRLGNPDRAPRISVALGAAIFALGALAAIYFAWPAYRALLPLQIEGGGIWQAYHADALRAGLPLYSFDVFVTNNYPPLSFYLLNALSSLTGVDVLYVGRVLCLAATLATGFGVWACVRSLGGSALGAAVAAAWWVATAAKWYSVWVGRDDPHLVALAVMTGCLAYILRHPRSDRALVAVAIMAVAGFYKHSLFAIPLVSLLWLTMHDRRRGMLAVVVGLGTVAIGLALCGTLYGAVFFHCMLMPRVYHLGRGLGHLGLVQFIAPAVIIALIWAAYRRRVTGARFAVLFIVTALVIYLVQSAGEGVADNAIFELTVAAALGLGLAFGDLAAIPAARSFGPKRSQLLVVCILIARFLLSQYVTPYLLLFSPALRAELNERIAIMEAETARIAAMPGLVVCDYQMPCRSAGKPMLFDQFAVTERVNTGQMTAHEVGEIAAARGIRFEQIDRRVDVSDLR